MSRWVLLVPTAVIVLVIVVFAWGWRPLKIYYREMRQERVLRATWAAVENYNKDLSAEIASLETTEGIQEYARRELNLVEEGDNGIIVMRDGKVLKPRKNSRESQVGDIPNTYRPFGSWTAFFDSLFGNGN